MLTTSQIEQYWTKGWLVVDGVFEPREAEAVALLADRFSAVEQGGGASDHADDGTTLPRKVNRPFTKDQQFRDFVLDPRLRQVVGQLLPGTPLLATDQIFMKPPRFGSAKPYHQDNFYFECSPADSVITAWIALDDVTEANGCLRYIDGSHREGILAHTPMPGEPYNLVVEDALIDHTRESLALVRRGGVVFHHAATLHTSHRNTSESWRRAYASHWVTPATTSTSSVLEQACYKLPEYPLKGASPR